MCIPSILCSVLFEQYKNNISCVCSPNSCFLFAPSLARQHPYILWWLSSVEGNVIAYLLDLCQSVIINKILYKDVHNVVYKFVKVIKLCAYIYIFRLRQIPSITLNSPSISPRLIKWPIVLSRPIVLKSKCLSKTYTMKITTQGLG